MNGRGAWSKIGMPAGAGGFYRLMSPVRIGSEPTRDEHFLAVNYGVKVIQRRCIGMGFSSSKFPVDGVFGERTDIAVRWAQGKLGLISDGAVGPKTMFAMLWPLLQADSPILNRTIGGMIQNESGWDPGAVSFEYRIENGPDRGLVQINEKANPDVSIAEAFDHRFSFRYANIRLSNALATYGNLDIAIADHNSPAWARQWFLTGSAPNATILAYVQRIKAWAPPT